MFNEGSQGNARGEKNKNLQSILKAAEVFDLGAEEQVSQLSEGQEDDDEHDKEACQVLSTAA